MTASPSAAPPRDPRAGRTRRDAARLLPDEPRRSTAGSALQRRREAVGWLPAAWLVLGTLVSPLPARAQPAGSPDLPVAPIAPTKILRADPLPPAAQVLRLQALASHCAACHGSAGHAVADSAVPGLAGASAVYLAAQMRAFKSGARTGTVMPQIAKGYSDAQIDQLAGYFAVQSISSGQPK